MFNNIFFMGGIHGVGKSTICRKICDAFKMKYLSASEVLKWKDINKGANSKKIENIAENQDHLITGLQGLVNENRFYFLDGHFCLLNQQEQILKVPFITFQHIKPLSISLIIDDISNIQQRLEQRDKQGYSFSILERMQAAEIEYATEVAEQLEIPLTIGKLDNYDDAMYSIKNLLEKTRIKKSKF